MGELLGDALGPELEEAPGTALGDALEAVLGPCFGQRRLPPILAKLDYHETKGCTNK
jgi:hypothetical protein